MTIGKYCQICGEKKKPGRVIAEARGIVVTAPCMMSKVFGDRPADTEAVRGMARFCAVCGAEQELPLPDHCGSCGAALTSEAAAQNLERAGDPAAIGPRIIAFLVDLLIIAGLSYLAIMGIDALEAGISAPAVEMAEEEVQGLSFFTVVKIAAVAVIFILFHSLFVYLSGRTPGKLLMGLKVLLKDGTDRIGFFKSVLRSALYFFTMYVVPIGFIPMVFQEPRSGWAKMIEQDAMFHDSLTDTVVIRPVRRT